MANKIKVNIPGFGERYCSNNVDYELFNNGYYYIFYKKGTNIFHNEYGPVSENKNGGFAYFINNKFHRLDDCACYNFEKNYKSYYVIGRYLGNSKEEFIKNLENILVPKE